MTRLDPAEWSLGRALRARVVEAIELLLGALARDAGGEGEPARLPNAELYPRVLATVLRQMALRFAGARLLASSGLASAALFRDERFRLGQGGAWDAVEQDVYELLGQVRAPAGLVAVPYGELDIEGLGGAYETFLALSLGGEGGARRLTAGHDRRRSGSFFTPRALTEQVVARALAQLRARSNGAERGVLCLRVCDPALGGGAFLLEVCRQLAAERCRERGEASETSALRGVAEACVFGVDISPLAVALAEVSLWLLVADEDLPASTLGARLRVADGLEDETWRALVGDPPDLDLVIGNPPWVAYAGRAAQPLERARRKHYAARFKAFRGYPTLHGLFVERAARIAPNGVLALVVPSPVADLAGYGAVRRVVTERHVLDEPLLEFGQDAFENVTQPSFALVARASPDAEPSERPWQLAERQRARASAREIVRPACFERFDRLPRLHAALFGEMGFQSTRAASENLFLRATEARGPFRYPLLEGRDVFEFRVGAPRLFLNDDEQALKHARCRARPREQYARVAFVVRQTAKVPIAALHSGLPFRNSLLAGFAADGYSAELLVALLNSAIYRALHVTGQRDARQAVFPQVKIRHLRALPAPPRSDVVFRELEAYTRAATANTLTPELRAEIDRATFALFGLAPVEIEQVLGVLRELAPELEH